MAIAKMATEMITYLKAQADVAAVCAGRVYAGIMPQGNSADLSTLVFSQVDAAAPRDLQRKIGLVESRWQFDCYGGDSYAQAEILAAAVDLALVDNFAGLATITVQQCVRVGGPTDFSSQDGDKTVRRLMLDYTIFYEEQ